MVRYSLAHFSLIDRSWVKERKCLSTERSGLFGDDYESQFWNVLTSRLCSSKIRIWAFSLTSALAASDCNRQKEELLKMWHTDDDEIGPHPLTSLYIFLDFLFFLLWSVSSNKRKWSFPCGQGFTRWQCGSERCAVRRIFQCYKLWLVPEGRADELQPCRASLYWRGPPHKCHT